jgi:hypothetical protein
MSNECTHYWDEADNLTVTKSTETEMEWIKKEYCDKCYHVRLTLMRGDRKLELNSLKMTKRKNLQMKDRIQQRGLLLNFTKPNITSLIKYYFKVSTLLRILLLSSYHFVYTANNSSVG